MGVFCGQSPSPALSNFGTYRSVFLLDLFSSVQAEEHFCRMDLRMPHLRLFSLNPIVAFGSAFFVILVEGWSCLTEQLVRISTEELLITTYCSSLLNCLSYKAAIVIC